MQTSSFFHAALTVTATALLLKVKKVKLTALQLNSHRNIWQQEWQRDLLLKYGNTISLIDATYKPQDMSVHYSLCVFVPMLATLLLQNLFWNQNVQKASVRHCIFYIAGIQNGIPSFGCMITQMLRYMLLNAVFQTRLFTSVTSIVNTHWKGGSKMGNMA